MELTLSFPEKSKAEANMLAADLQTEIEQLGEPVQVQRVRDNPDTLDFGATLAIVLAAPAVVGFAKGAAPAVIEVAKGIASWMRRTGNSVKFKCGETEITLKDVDTANLPAVLAAMCAGKAAHQ